MGSLNKKNFDIVSTYSGDKCLPFLKTTDKLNGLDLDLGNMSGHFPFKLGLSGKHIDIPTSEHLYVCGFFSDGSEMQTSIQRQILFEPNAMMMKRKYRKGMYDNGRGDFDSSPWRFEWMLFCVWSKVQGNAIFRENLAKIPDEHFIIENANKDGVNPLWGCYNGTVRTLINRWCKEHENSFKTKAAFERAKDEYRLSISNQGEWRGYNVLGKILMMCRDAVHKGDSPDIDYALLQKAGIHLLGDKLLFTQMVISKEGKNDSNRTHQRR